MAKATQHKFHTPKPVYAAAGAGEIAYKKARSFVEDFDPKAAKAKVESLISGLQKQAVDYRSKASESAKSMDPKATRAKMESLLSDLEEQAKLLPAAIEGLVSELQDQAKAWPTLAQDMVSDFDAKSMQTKAGSVYAELLTDVKKTIAELGTTYSSLAEHGQSVVSGEAPAPTKPAAKKPAAKKTTAKKTTAKKATAKKPAAKKATAKKTVTQTPVETVSQAKPDSE
jgi:hypothetical protein